MFRRLSYVLASALLVLAISPTAPARASSNNQVMLSATGVTTSVGPAGWWLWSQPGGNAYGNDGTGNVYFYAIGVQKPVEISDIVLSGNQVWETVTGKGDSFTCWFWAQENARQGNQNGVTSFRCDAGAGNATATNVPSKVQISSFSG
jgi:hypothetical protein